MRETYRQYFFEMENKGQFVELNKKGRLRFTWNNTNWKDKLALTTIALGVASGIDLIIQLHS